LLQDDSNFPDNLIGALHPERAPGIAGTLA
jgi:hypothetical protein